MLLYQTIAFTIDGKNIKKSYKNNKFKISAPTQTDKFKLPDGSLSVSNIQDYFEYIINKHDAVSDNPSIRIYINKQKIRSHLK